MWNDQSWRQQLKCLILENRHGLGKAMPGSTCAYGRAQGLFCCRRREGRSDAESTCCNGAVMRGTTLHFRPEKPLACTNLISEDAFTPWRPNKCIWLGQNYEAAARRDTNRENFVYISSKSNQDRSVLQPEHSWWRCKETEMCLVPSTPTKRANMAGELQ